MFTSAPRAILLNALLLVPRVLLAQANGTIAGTITSASGGTPIASASVQILDTSGDVLIATSTDVSGAYSVGVAPGGSYNVFVSAAGFGPQLHAGIPCAAVDCPKGRGTPVAVTASTTTTVNVALPVEGRITGRSTQAANGAVTAGTTIAVYNAAGSFVATVTLDASGDYAVEGLPAGTYFARSSSITFSAASDWLDEMYGGAPCPRAPGTTPCRVTLGTPITVVAGATTAGINFSLDAAGRISGTVTGVGEAVQAGTALYAYSGGVVVGGSVTDAAGNYTITGLPSGFYSVRTDVQNAYASSSFQNPPSNLVDEWNIDVCFACGGTPFGAQVTAGQTTTIDFVLTTGGTIGGTLTLGPLAAGLSGGISPEIKVYSATGLLVKTIVIPTVSTGPLSWQAAGLPAGQYYVRSASRVRIQTGVSPNSPTSGWWVDTLHAGIECIAADCLPTRGTPVTVTAGATTAGVALVASGGATISGTYPGSFPSSATFTIYDSRGVELPNRVATDLNSHFTAAGLPGGVYFLKLNRDLLGRFASVLYKDQPCEGCAVTFGTPIVVTDGEQKTGIDFPLPPGRAITGTVRSGGTPLSTITVEVFEHNGNLIGSAVSAADGVYTVPGLNPGTYYARTSNQRGFADELYSEIECGGCNPVLGTAIVVAAGADTTGIDFSLVSATPVSGTVTRQLANFVGGPPSPPTTGVAGGIGIRFTNSGGQLSARVVTDGFGHYETSLVPGDYTLETEPTAEFGRVSQAVTVGATPLTVDFLLFGCGARTIAPISLANAAVGAVYRQTLTFTGGPAPGTYSIVSGALPPGLTLDASGVISGTPTSAGSYTFTVGVRDNISCGGARTYTVSVEPCVFTAQGSATSRASGEPFLLPVSSTCGTWTATSNVSWITIAQTSTGPNGFVLLVTQPYTGGAPRIGTVSVGPRVITIYQNGVATQPPFGVLETPDNGAVVSGSIAVSGWALDDLGLYRVQIYRDSVAGEAPGLVFLGNATQVPGARPDVEAAFPSLPNARNAGYGYLLLTNMLPNGGNGTFTLHAYAVDADLVSTLIGSRTIVAANSAAITPFGAIDTPDQGATIAGSAYVNFGWALTPQPQMIPPDGSTISVVIDGVSVGTVNAYNLARSDVSGLFPGLKNSAGPVGYRMIDTTALSEGQHTIAWVATDDAGQATGIGSRYFTVQNSAWVPSDPPLLKAAPPAVTATELALASSTTAVPPRIDGIELGRKAASLAQLPIVESARTVDLGSLQRLELSLGNVSACAGAYEGYSLIAGELRPLPIGSSLDSTGTFYWQPGPGFHGTYRLVFVHTGCDGSRERIPVSVRIR